MRSQQFYRPGSLLIERQIHREGPRIVWVCWKPNSAMSFTDTKALLAFAGWPKSTPTGQELRAWIDSVDTADTDATVSTADTAKAS